MNVRETMRLSKYVAHIAVKSELKDLAKWIDENPDFQNDPESGFGVMDTRNEVQRRIDDPLRSEMDEETQ